MSPRQRMFIALLVSIGLTVIGCRRSSDDEGEGDQPAPVVAVRVAPVQSGRALVTISAFGRTEALRKERIFSPIAGIVTELHALEGSRVHAGDVLAVVMSKESEASIAGAEALVRNAATDAQRRQAEQALALARGAAHGLALRARNDGIVATRSLAEGELVAENGEICSVVDLRSLVFVAAVPISQVASVRTGQVAMVRVPAIPGHAFAGAVETVFPESDPQNQTVKVRVRFTDAAARTLLRDEMVGTAAIVTDVRPNALFVPRSALLRDDESMTNSVVLMTADSLSHTIPVQVGVVTDTTAEVVSPLLRAGMAVIAQGNYALPESTRVTVRPQAAE